MLKLFIFIIIFFVSSCSLFQKEERLRLKNYQAKKNSDYLDYFASVGVTYINYEKENIWKVTGNEKIFLDNLYKKLKINNELVFSKNEDPVYYIVFTNRPIYFALPGGQFFLSSGLISKYLKNEDLLLAVIAREALRWNSDLYPKKVRVPVGYITGEEILDEIRLPLNLRVELNKWVYNAIKRTGVDASVYLNWLQLQNKNILDFSMLAGDVNVMAREEFLFKDFLISMDVFEDKYLNQRSSSEGFYNLKEKTRRMYETRKN